MITLVTQSRSDSVRWIMGRVRVPPALPGSHTDRVAWRPGGSGMIRSLFTALRLFTESSLSLESPGDRAPAGPGPAG
eukprot:747268-Hanusia_phi.AAC.7